MPRPLPGLLLTDFCEIIETTRCMVPCEASGILRVRALRAYRSRKRCLKQIQTMIQNISKHIKNKVLIGLIRHDTTLVTSRTRKNKATPSCLRNRLRCLWEGTKILARIPHPGGPVTKYGKVRQSKAKQDKASQRVSMLVKWRENLAELLRFCPQFGLLFDLALCFSNRNVWSLDSYGTGYNCSKCMSSSHNDSTDIRLRRRCDKYLHRSLHLISTWTCSESSDSPLKMRYNQHIPVRSS